MRSGVRLFPNQREAIKVILAAHKRGVNMTEGPNAYRAAVDELLGAGISEDWLRTALQVLGLPDKAEGVAELIKPDALIGVNLGQKPPPLSDLESSRQILAGRP